MRIARLRLRDFRSYTTADVRVGPGVTVVHGRNGAGKTNLLEALYVGCTGASWRAASDRELVRFGAEVARVELDAEAEDGAHAFSVGLEPGKRKRLCADGVAVDRLSDVAARPLAAVFLPDRLDLVKGGPALRRAHVDQVIAALWPARAATRREYGRALAQRNALLARGPAAERSLDAWDAELARHGAALMADRAAVVAELAPRFTAIAEELGLEGGAELTYRPRAKAADAVGLAAELRERRARDLERRFTAHGPHRDDLGLARAGRDLRPFGSQGQQRLAVLALLLAEREAIGEVRGTPPMMLLDDAMSELDAGRRERLVARLRGAGAGPAGQSVITTTDLAAVPGADAPDTARLAVAEGVVLSEAEAHAA
jgi:DNA replication and repair protein RecF